MVTLKDKETRYAALRAEMKEQGLDAMLVICDAQIEKKGLLKYLTNYRNTLYNLVAIFPLEGEPRLLVPSPVQVVWAARLSWINQVVLEKPALEPVLVEQIKDMGLEKAKFGIASLKIMNAYTFGYLKENLPGASFVEASDLIDALRVIKTEDEIDNMKETAKILVDSFAYGASIVKPGMTEQELIAAMDTYLVTHGAQDIFHLICSKPGSVMPFIPSDRKLEEGDTIIINTEISGPSGYWVQMVRTMFLGEPKGNTAKMYRELKDICNQLPTMMVPGARCCDICNWVVEQTAKHGYKVGVFFGHGQGLDVVEKPGINPNDTTLLEPNMSIVVHPQFVSQDDTETVWFCDNYRVRENGPAEILTETPDDFLQVKL